MNNIKHNHVSRDIKQVGECPACDEYHDKNIPKRKSLLGELYKSIVENHLSSVKELQERVKRLERLEKLEIENATCCMENEKRVKELEEQLKLKAENGCCIVEHGWRIDAEHEVDRLKEQVKQLELEIKSNARHTHELEFENANLKKEAEARIKTFQGQVRLNEQLDAKNKILTSALRSAKGFVDEFDGVGITKVIVNEALKAVGVE